MDGFVLNAILLKFQAAYEHNAVALITLLEPSWFVLIGLAFVLLLLSVVVDHGRFFPVMLVGLTWLGATHILFLRGWEWAESISYGTRHVAQHLGAPAFNPSAILELGSYVAAPLLTSVANQGALGFVWHPSTIPFAMSGIAMFLAYCVLALVQFALLLMNYLLIGGAPFFLLWLPVPGLSAIGQLWIQLMCGNLAGLFVCGQIAGIMRDLGQAMAERYHAVFANAAGVTTLTWNDYSEPLGTALVMAIAFAWIPLSFSKAAFGIAGSLVKGGGMLLGAASYAVTMPSSSGGGGGSNDGGSNKNGSGQQQITSSPGTGWGGGGMAPAPQPVGAWGRP